MYVARDTTRGARVMDALGTRLTSTGICSARVCCDEVVSMESSELRFVERCES